MIGARRVAAPFVLSMTPLSSWIVEIIHHVVDAKLLQHGAITRSLA
jgi:hypothetical protein